VIAGTAPGGATTAQITLFDSRGLRGRGFLGAGLAEGPGETRLCQPLDLIADPDDPRDLWGMLMRAGPDARPV
jgi:ornithine cyclodeaminase